MFEDINQRIRLESVHLRDEINPLQTILLTKPDFTLPLFYALCNIMKSSTIFEIAEGLTKLCEPVKDILPRKIPHEANSLTFNTILHCAFHAVPLETREGIYMKNIGKGWESMFESTTTAENMRNNLKFFQDRFFPVAKGAFSLHHWDHMDEEWQSVSSRDKAFWKFKFQQVYHEISYFEGFKNIPPSLRRKLITKLDWVKPLVQEKAKDTMEMVMGNALPGTYEEFKKLFGRNVPEYYFFDHWSYADCWVVDTFSRWSEKQTMPVEQKNI